MIEPRTLHLVNDQVKSSAMTIISNLPVDGTLQIVIGPRKKTRSESQNALMWAAVMADISQQAWVMGKQFSNDAWHEHLKREFLPEGNEPDYERMVTKRYRKWDYLPNGDRVLAGSTTQLTTFGFSQYIEAVMAYASQELGVMFTARMAA